MDFCSIPVASKLCSAADAIDFVADPGKAITEGIGNWIAKSAGELAATAADLAAKAVDTTTKVDLNAAWFRDNYETLLPIGLIILVATFSAQLIRASVRRDGQALTQAFTGTAIGVLFAFGAIALTTVAIEVVDALSDGLFKAAGSSVEDAVRRMVKVSQIGALSGLGWLVPTLAALGAAFGAVLYWCVMMVRKVGILVLVTLAVFAGAGGGWEVAQRWRKGWIEATATLIVSKLLMTIVFLLGISAMGKTEAKDGLGALADVLSGVVIMVLVLLCPYATFKFVHWAAEGSDGETLHRAGGSGAQMARQHTERAGRKVASMASSGGAGGAAAGAGAAPQGPSDIPGQGPGGVTAANPSSGESPGGQDGGPTGSPAVDMVKKGAQPPPTRPGEASGGHLSRPTSGSAAGGPSSQGADDSQWGVTAPPPQGAPSSSQSQAASGPTPPPPAGN